MIVISENKLREIMSSVIEEHLSERGTNLSSLYHFTDVNGLAGIMEKGAFKLSSWQRDIRDGKNYMSFTRHKSPLEGFALPNGSFVRIEVIPEVINSIHGKSIDSFEYYSPNMAKKADKCNPWSNMASDNGDRSAKAAYRVTKYKPIDWFHAEDAEFLNQAEEHLTSDKIFIDAEKAIKRIDIYVEFDKSFCQSYKEHIYRGFLTVFGMTNSPLYDKIFIYDNKRDFSLQTDNCIPIREYSIEKLQDALGFDGAGQNVAESIIKTNRTKTNKNMKKNIVKLNEAKLRKIISKLIKESMDEYYENGPYTHATDLGDDDALIDAEKDYMWNKYGNRSVVPDAGVEHEDDAYTRKDMDSGELAMQALGAYDDDTPKWGENGRSSKWASPKGDFRTVSESTLRKMISKSVKKALKENVSEIADSNGYYQVLNYLHDIRGTEEGARILNALYGGGYAAEEMAIEELHSMFPSAKMVSVEAAIAAFKKEMERGYDIDGLVAENVKKALSESLARPSEGTLMKAKELYDYLYDVQDESDATSALYKMISDWLNEQYPGEMNAAIGG